MFLSSSAHIASPSEICVSASMIPCMAHLTIKISTLSDYWKSCSMERYKRTTRFALVPQRHCHPEFTMFQIGQRFIDLVVAITLRNQTLQFDSSLFGHLEHFFDVVRLPARHAGNGDLSGDEVAAADRKRSAAQPADDRGRPAWTRGLDDLIASLGITDGLERLIDPASSKLHHRFHGILRRRIDRVRRAEG